MTRRAFVTVLAVFAAGVAGLVATTRSALAPPRPAVAAFETVARPLPLAAAQRPIATATGTTRRPVLLVREGDAPSRPIALEAADYEVTVAGLVARTRATLTFRNDMPRVLEGEFVYPLPEGAVLSGFALDVAGQMLDGVVVEAQRARVAFEAEVRKGIDPGLVEWVRGNNFRTRIWPVPAGGRRTVRLEYISELVDRTGAGGLEASYELPLRFGTVIDRFSLRVEVVRTDLAPVVRSGLANFAFAQWQDRYVAEATRRDVSPDDLVVALPRVPRDTVVVETERDGETYFTVDDFPDVPAASTPAARRPRRIGVVWDATLSRAGADRERDLRILGRHLSNLGDVTVRAVVLRNVAEPPREFIVRAGDALALIDFLRAQPCDGATNLAAMTLPGDVDYAVVFSDGLWTLGGRPAWQAAQPVFAISGAAEADHTLLSAMAAATGGAYINLQRHTDEEAAGRIGRPAFALLGVSASGIVADVEPAVVQPVAGRVTIAGRLRSPEATLRLRYGVAGGDEVVRTIEIRRATGTSTGLAARRWAQRRVAALSLDPEVNRDEIVRLGQQFSIVTPGTSLLVLERLEQFIEHDVAPPESAPALRAAFDERMRGIALMKVTQRDDRLRNVLRMWQQRMAWWSRTFTVDPGFRYKEPPTQRRGAGVAAPAPSGADRGAVSGVEGSIVGGMVGGVPEAPPPLPPPASPAAGAGGFSEALAPNERSILAADAPGARPEGGTGAIAVAAWNPDTPYLRALEATSPARAYETYLAERARFGTSPAFFLDCADFFARRGDRDLAVRILTNVAELRLEDARLLRVLGHRLEQIDELDRAVEVFEQVRRLRPEEPQSLRDLALALDRRAASLEARAATVTPAATAQYERALVLLAEVVMGEWDGRFPEVQVVAIEEANRIADALQRGGAGAWPLDPRLRQHLEADVRIVLTWDTDQTDMDLWVVEPSGERCFYGHALTTIGGAMTKDFTGGLGPEVYAIRRAMAGTYTVQANFYGSRAQTLTGPTTVQAVVFTNYGRASEQRRSMTLRLAGAKDVVDIGAVSFTP